MSQRLCNTDNTLNGLNTLNQNVLGYDSPTYDENNQQNTLYVPPASPMTQETTTIHYVPSNHVSNWEMNSSNNHGTWNGQGCDVYYDVAPPSQENQFIYYSNDTIGDSNYYNNPYISQVETRQYRPFQRASYKLDWEQPIPVILNQPQNQAMKQFMQRNSGGGCVVMQPTPRERVATPSSDYLQRFHPYCMDNQFSLIPPEPQQGPFPETYSNVYMAEPPYCSTSLPETNLNVSHSGEDQQQRSTSPFNPTFNNNIYPVTPSEYIYLDTTPPVSNPNDIIPRFETPSNVEESDIQDNKEMDENATKQNQKSNLEKRESEERHAILDKVLDILENEAATNYTIEPSD